MPSSGSVAQGLEHWSRKPGVVSSNLIGALQSGVLSPEVQAMLTV